MTTNYHTAITVGASANAATINTPLAALDAQLVANQAAIDALTLASGNAATLANGAASAGQKVIVVDATSGFLAGAPISYTLVGGAVEQNTIATIDSSTQMTCTGNIGTGGIANNTYIATLPLGVYSGQIAGATVQAQAFVNGITLDTITEKTSAAGVTVDGVLLKDKGATMAGNLILDPPAAPSYLTATVNPAAGNLNGDYIYAVVFVFSDNSRTNGGALSAVVSPANQKVDLSAIPVSDDPTCTAREIYRTVAGAEAALMYLAITIVDNTTTTYTDNVADGSLGASINWTNTKGGLIYYNDVRSGILNNSVTAWGWGALQANKGLWSSAFGSGCLYNNTTGYFNVAMGVDTMLYNTTGKRNSAFGADALQRNTTGDYNTAIGEAAAILSETGNNNVAVGKFALYNNTSSSDNTAIGTHALINATGAENTVVGSFAGDNVTTGKRNVIIGYSAGNITTGDNNIIIGYNTAAPSATASNQLNIGDALYGDLSSGYFGIENSAPTSRLTIDCVASGPTLDAKSPAALNIVRSLGTDLVFSLQGTGDGTASIQHRHAVLNGYAYPLALNPLGGPVGVGTAAPAGALHAAQIGSAAALPVLKLEQSDVDQDMIEFACTAGTGNAIEAVGAKTLTTTAFIKVTVNGDVRYIPCGTIA